MNAFPVNPDYAELLSRIPPKVIRSEEENEKYIEALYELEQRSDTLSPEEQELSDLLTLIIEDFEEKHHKLPQASPAEVVQFLAEQHGMQRDEVGQLLDSPEEVFSGGRELTTHEIRRLSQRFHVSPEVFF